MTMQSEDNPGYETLRKHFADLMDSSFDPQSVSAALFAAGIVGKQVVYNAKQTIVNEQTRRTDIVSAVQTNGAPGVFRQFVQILEKSPANRAICSKLIATYKREGGSWVDDVVTTSDQATSSDTPHSRTVAADGNDSGPTPPALPDHDRIAVDGAQVTDEPIEIPKFSMDDELPEPMAIPQGAHEKIKLVKNFAEKVRIVIQTCNDAEYYAVLGMLEPPRIENPKFAKPCRYFHKKLGIVVGTFAGIDAAIVETPDQGTECKQGLETAVEVFRNAKFLLGLGICYGLKKNSAKKNLEFADVLVSDEIGISTRPKLEPKGLNPRETSFEKISVLMKNIFCVRPNWDGIVVCDEPKQRTAKVYVGRLLSASILMNDSTRMGLIEEKWRGYLGGEMEGAMQFEIPGVVNIVIKGITDFGGNKGDKWQLTAAKAAVDYAHHKLEQYGYIEFNEL